MTKALLFVAERHHGVRAGSTPGWHIARQEGNADEQERDANVGEGIVRCYPYQEVAQQIPMANAQPARLALLSRNRIAPGRQIIASTSLGWAPSAMRIPISEVRRLTE